MRKLRAVLALLLGLSGITAFGVVHAGPAVAVDLPVRIKIEISGVEAHPPGTFYCYPDIGYPHNSSHVLGTVNTKGTVECERTVASLRIDIRLLYNGGPVSTGARQNWYKKDLSANAAAPCLPGIYRGEMDLTIVPPPGYWTPAPYTHYSTPDQIVTCV